MSKSTFSAENRPLFHCPAPKMRASFLGTCLLVCLSASPVLAAPPPMTMSVDADNPALNAGDAAGGFTSGIERQSTMLGNMWGLRPWLGQSGITFSLQET